MNSDNVLIICITMVVLLCAGEPDLLDAIMKWITK